MAPRPLYSIFRCLLGYLEPLQRTLNRYRSSSTGLNCLRCRISASSDNIGASRNLSDNFSPLEAPREIFRCLIRYSDRKIGSVFSKGVGVSACREGVCVAVCVGGWWVCGGCWIPGVLYQFSYGVWGGLVCWSPGGSGEMSSDLRGMDCGASSSEYINSVIDTMGGLSGGEVGEVVSSSGVSRDGVRAVHDLPLDVSGERVLSLVEHLLVELEYEPVGVAYRRRAVGGAERMEYVAVPGSSGEVFERHRYVPRHGWVSETVSRATVREDLVTVCHCNEDAQVIVRSRESLESVRGGFALRAWQPGGGDRDGSGSAGVAGV